MEGYDWEDNFDEGDDNFGGEAGAYSGKNVIMFVVYGGEGMHVNSSQDIGGQTLFQKAIQAAADTYKHKIFSSPSDVLGVMSFGTTNKVPDTADFENISVLCPPETPSATSIRLLEDLTLDSGTTLFKQEYGTEGGVRLHEVLWQCQSLVAGVKGNIASRRILLLTCDPDPHAGDQTLNIQARRKAGDLHANNIYLDVVPVTQDRNEGDEIRFDMSIIYSDIMRLADDDYTGANQSLDMLSETVLKKTFIKRSTGKLQFSINGINVGVKLYNLLGRSSKPKKEKMVVNSTDQVKSERTWVHPVDQTPLLPNDMNRFMRYGGKNIQMTADEVNHIRACGKDTNFIRLLGFRDKDSLKIGNHVKLPQFLYPYEDTVKGSSNIINALLTRCASKNKVAICSYKPRSVSGPCYVALLPQLEVVEDGSQVKPPGFHIIHLPFMDDQRKMVEIRMKKENPREAVEAAKAVINKLKLKSFVPVEDTSLQSVYKTIEAHALNKETMQQVEDESLPDYERMKRKLGERSEAFLREVYTEGYDPEKFKPAKKSKPSNDGVTKPKVEKAPATGLDDQDMKAAVEAGTVNKLTNDVLKAWLKSHGVTISNKKKAQLVEDVVSLING